MSTFSQLHDDLKIFPNPVKDFLHVKSNDEIISIHILNLTGKLIDTVDDLNVTSLQLSLHSFSAGCYIFHFETSKGVLSKKVIISK